MVTGVNNIWSVLIRNLPLIAFDYAALLLGGCLEHRVPSVCPMPVPYCENENF